MAWSRVQGVRGVGSATTSFAVTITAATAGSVLVCSIAANSAITGIGISDNAGGGTNAYADTGVSQTGTGIVLYEWFGVQTNGGATSITLSWAASNTVRMIVEEFTGGASSNAAIKGVGSGNTGTGTSGNCGTFTPTSGDLVVAQYLYSADSGALTAGSGYTAGFTGSTQHKTEYNTNSSTSETAPASWANSVLNTTQIGFSYHVASGGGGGGTTSRLQLPGLIHGISADGANLQGNFQ